MDEELERLRSACKGYPRHDVVEAVRGGLIMLADAGERRALASILAAWLTDDEPGIEPPELPAVVIAAIQRKLRSRAH